jgi:hypothetical protein
MKTDRDAEYRHEADRLRLIDRADQRRVVSYIRAVAGNPKVGKIDRDLARKRADALERLLGLKRPRKSRR